MWNTMGTLGSLLGNPISTSPMARQLAESKAAIRQREKDRGIGRNFNSPYDIADWDKKKKGSGRRRGVKQRKRNGVRAPKRKVNKKK